MAGAQHTFPKPTTIQQKIEQARALFTAWGSQLLAEPRVVDLVKLFERRADNTRESIRDFGVVAICRECEEKRGGSCCGAGIENKYTDVLLLVNLLLGNELPRSRQKPDSCYFLGGQGCMLKARHALCTNYLCFRIEQCMCHERFIKLQHTGGEEIDTLFMLCEEVRKVLRRYAPVHC